MKNLGFGSVAAEKNHTGFFVKTDEKELQNEYCETIIAPSRPGCKDIWNF